MNERGIDAKHLLSVAYRCHCGL